MIEIGIERISPGRVKNVRGDRKKIEREKNEGRTEKARTGKSGDLRIIREEEGEGRERESYIKKRGTSKRQSYSGGKQGCLSQAGTGLMSENNERTG